MIFSKFKDIVRYNKEFEQDVLKTVQKFNDCFNWSGDITKLIKEVGDSLGVFVVELPIKNEKFGAQLLKTPYSCYLILNSLQPRNKMYFSFCHEVYHILEGSTNYLNEIREVCLNEEYVTDPKEYKANCFAAHLLMPKEEFKKMHRLYSEKENEVLTIIFKLMNYFNAPYTAILIRLTELELLPKGVDLKNLLNFNVEFIGEELQKRWISKECLLPTRQDDSNLVIHEMKNKANELIEKDLLSQYNADKIIERTKKLLDEVKGENG